MSVDPQSRRSSEPEEISGFAIGGLAFAATVMVIIGSFQIIAGLVAIFDDEFFVVTRNYTFDLDTTAWGWLHLLIGILVLSCGFALFARRAWAAVATVFFASLSAVANFFFIPYYPAWSILVIALDIWVIWAVTRPGVIRD
jgi:hypothetical protein